MRHRAARALGIMAVYMGCEYGTVARVSGPRRQVPIELLFAVLRLSMTAFLPSVGRAPPGRWSACATAPRARNLPLAALTRGQAEIFPNPRGLGPRGKHLAARGRPVCGPDRRRSAWRLTTREAPAARPATHSSKEGTW